MKKYIMVCTFTFDDTLTEKKAIALIKKQIPKAFNIIVETECSGIFYLMFETDFLGIKVKEIIKEYDLKGECFDVFPIGNDSVYNEDNLKY